MSILVTAGMVVRKIFASHLHFLSKPIASHRTAFASHSHLHRTFRNFFPAFLHFFHLFGRFFTVIEWKPRKKCKKICENAKNAKSAIYECDAKKIKNSHRIALMRPKKKSHFRTFSHRTTIPELRYLRHVEPNIQEEEPLWATKSNWTR